MPEKVVVASPEEADAVATELLHRQAMTWEEFITDANLPHHHYEYVEGHAVEMPMVTKNHTSLRSWLLMCGGLFKGMNTYAGCDGEPYKVRTPAGNARAPDVFFWNHEQDKKAVDHVVEGPVDLVIEILSPSTYSDDYGPKLREYQAAGCREYWILDPLNTIANDYFELVDGKYRPFLPDFEGDRQIIRSRSVSGLWFDVVWFVNQPPVTEVLRAWQEAA